MHFFITRSLSSTSAFQKLREKGHQVTDKSLVQINFLDFTTAKESDWIFFYSSNGIKAYFDKQKFDANIKYGVMGSGSAQTFETLTGHTPLFIGNGNPKNSANFFLKEYTDATICFAKATTSLDHVEQLISDKIKCQNVIVYSNTKKAVANFPSFDVLIFTSPLNVEAYFDTQGYHDEVVFAIGETTAKKVYSVIGVSPHYCTAPSEENLYNLVVGKLS